MTRGRGEGAKRAEVSTPETAHKGKKHVARDERIIWAATDRLKDEVAASLLREQEGGRALHVPRGASSEMFAEYAAEKRTDEGWEKKAGIRRNEALDLSVCSLALVIVLGAEGLNWEHPPAWPAEGEGNAFEVKPMLKRDEESWETEEPPAVRARSVRGARWRRGGRPRFDGWG